MDPKTISALIALIGVVISVIISFITNRRLLKTDLEKIEVNIVQSYASKLIDKRLDFILKFITY